MDRGHSSMLWVGLTGGLGSGKSTVTKMLIDKGLAVIDADQISRSITLLGASGYKGIVSHFGTSILDQNKHLDRRALGKIVFSDSSKRIQLEKILHPLIREEVARQRSQYEKDKKSICFYDVPLLFEKEMQPDFDLVVVIWCDPKIQFERLKSRDSLSDSEILSRMKSQSNMAMKIKNSDFCLDNSTDLVAMEWQIRNLIQTLTQARIST